jgi:DNA (cytosine-5)-methyltransferase 3A
MKVLSLFDGISCARVALSRAGLADELLHRTDGERVQYFASEIDANAIQIAQKNYPDTIQLGDVKTITKDLLASYMGNVEIDLLVGGSPCQDLSIAQKNRKGLDGERSGLFWEYIRILREVKPKWFILENVASMPKEAKDIITKELGVEPIMINAALVSAQNRKRLFWTNIPNVSQPDDRGIFLKDILEPSVDDTFTVRPKSNTVRSSGRGSGIDNKHNWDTIRIGSINSGGQGDRIYSPEGKSVGLSALGGGRGAKTGLYAVALRNRGQGKKPEFGGDKANAMTTVQTDSMVMENTQIRKLTPVECERLQGLPDNYTDGISNSQRYKCLGNAFNVDVVAHILSFIPNSALQGDKQGVK